MSRSSLETHGGKAGAVAAQSQEPALASMLRTIAGQALSAWKWVERKRTQQLAGRRLRVAETVSLGEKRFVSLIEVDGAQFLIAGAAGSVSLLAVLDPKQDAEAKLWHEATASEVQA